MPQILAQLAPPGAQYTPLYQVPVGFIADTTAIFVANFSVDPEAFTVKAVRNGETDGPQQFLYAAVEMPGNTTFVVDLDMTMNPGDCIRVGSANGKIAFTLFGKTTAQ